MGDRFLLRVPAIEMRQGPRRVLYSFAIDGKLLHLFATVSRIRRDEGCGLLGYQRPEVLSHISEIQSYIESANPMIPNSLVLAFDQRVRFEAFPDSVFDTGYSRSGFLVIPVDKSASDADKPAWIVDGQQRAAAIREAAVDSFPICVTGFVAADDEEQREQFILVNSTKPLPKGLIYELLPGTKTTLPSTLQRKRFPAHLVARLNQENRSPLRGLIQTPTTAGGIIKDNSLLRMLEHSLSDGVLFRFRDPSGKDGDVDGMVDVISRFWSAVAGVFEDAWALPPRKSRLMHGAGIISVGFLMDAISDRHLNRGIPTVAQFHQDLEPLREVCRWTNGTWDFGPGLRRKWNEIQNTPKDIQLLTNYLQIQYRMLVWDRVGATSSGQT
jgi:DGQHR domain-containing protein